MPLPRERAINCFLCDHYRPSDSLDFQGNCTHSPLGGDGSLGGTNPGNEFATISRPADTYCKGFKKWDGPARVQGNCYPLPVQE